MIKNVKIVIIQAFKSEFYQYFVFTKNTPTICLILHLYVLLFCGKKLVTMEIFLLTFLGGSKCVTKWHFLLIFLKRVENDPFLRPQIRAKDTFS